MANSNIKLTVSNGYRKTTLPNGLRIVTEDMPSVRSLSIGVYYDTGSRDEPEDLSGISHFLEHMNFKGTKRRSAAAIARAIEGRGGHLNAFTSKESTCFYAHIVQDQLPVAVDVLLDMTAHSLYDSDEVNRERGVILEELKNVEDTPDDIVFEHFMAQVYRGHPLERPVLGTREALARIDHSALIAYRDRHYLNGRTVIVAAGRIDHDWLVQLVQRRIGGGADNGLPPRATPPPPNETTSRQDLKTTTQQTHIVIGCRSFRYQDERKYALLVLNTILGGGMSSRLFQRVRERHGLAYSVYSFNDTYEDTGVFGVYAGTEPKRAEKALRLIQREIDDLTARPVSKRELNFNKDQLKGSLLLSLESPTSRMQRIAKMEIYTGRMYSLDEVTLRIEGVTADDVQAVARTLFLDQPMLTTTLRPN
ncbi:MAG: insulinase family protein [Calditrichaeota bacterium]|nr:insulinase family protein [Calditrichota bacterium]